MLEGIPITVYGRDAAHANRLRTINNSVTISAAAETPITVASANEYSYLTYMRADCVQAGASTAGYWSLRDGVGGTVILILYLPNVTLGSSYCWPFPVPWKTAQPNARFTLEPSIGTMGTWQVIVNGFHSSV